MMERWFVRLQALGGTLFLVFLVLHLSNTVLASISVEAYNGAQRLLRVFYQYPLIELVLVIGPLFMHAVAGVGLYVLRRRRSAVRPLKARPLRARLHSWAGVFLLLVVFGHVLATRGVSYWFGAIPEFAGVSFSLWWVPAYFYPYYFLLFVAGLYHGLMGGEVLLRRLGYLTRVLSDRARAAIIGMGAVAALFALLGFGGHLFEVHDPRDNDYARQYGELFGIDLTGELP